MKYLKLIPLALALSVLGGCVHSRIRYDYDVRTNYGAYRTFNWAPRGKVSEPAKSEPFRNQLMDKRVKQAVERELEAKGYKLLSTAEPDFHIHYFPVYQERMVQSTTHLGWGRRWHMGTSMSEIYTFTEGTIVLEVTDCSTKQLVWHGAAEGALTGLDNPEYAEEVVSREVKRLLSNFPPGK